MPDSTAGLATSQPRFCRRNQEDKLVPPVKSEMSYVLLRYGYGCVTIASCAAGTGRSRNVNDENLKQEKNNEVPLQKLFATA
jgi:hypothetical protein